MSVRTAFQNVARVYVYKELQKALQAILKVLSKTIIMYNKILELSLVASIITMFEITNRPWKVPGKIESSLKYQI